MIKNLKKKKGFTLIELIIVIAILGILAAIAIPKFASSKDSARIKADVSSAKTLADTTAMLIASEKINLKKANDTTVATEVSGYGDIDLGDTTGAAKLIKEELQTVPKVGAISGEFIISIAATSGDIKVYVLNGTTGDATAGTDKDAAHQIYPQPSGTNTWYK